MLWLIITIVLVGIMWAMALGAAAARVTPSVFDDAKNEEEERIQSA